MSTALKTQLAELTAKIERMEAEAKAKPKPKKAERDERFQPIWLQKSKNGKGKYPGGFVTTPKGEKVWVCIYPNKYWSKKNNQPAYHLTLDKPKPKKS